MQIDVDPAGDIKQQCRDHRGKRDFAVGDAGNLGHQESTRAQHRRRDLPAGGKRFVQRAQGYVATWVAGEQVQAQGVVTEALPGRLVRMGQG